MLRIFFSVKTAAVALVLLLSFSNLFKVQANEILVDTLQQVVINANLTTNRSAILPASATVIGQSQLEKYGQTSALSALNGQVPGLFITEKGLQGFGVSTGAAGQISIRGTGGSPTTGVLLMLDGVPQYMGLFGHPLADLYQTSEVNRIIVVRGPCSVLYGSNAMGGAINIITRQSSTQGFTGEASFQYGSFNTQDYQLNMRYTKEKWNILAFLNKNKTDGHRPHADFEQSSAYFKGSYNPSKNYRIYADYNLTRYTATDPGPDTLNAVYGSSMEIHRGSWSASVDHRFEKFSGTFKFFRNFGKHEFSDGFHSEDFENGFLMKENFRPAENTELFFGGEVLRYGGKAVSGTQTLLVDTSVVDAGVYGIIQQKVLRNIFLNSGLRFQHNSQYGNQWIPNATLSWRLSDYLTWKAGYGKGFRSPTVRELFLFNHNTALNAEKLRSFETGFSGERLFWNLQYEATLYFTRTTDKIVAGTMGKLYNLGTVENKGVELALNISPYYKVNLNLLYSRNSTRTPVYGTPKSQFSFQASKRIRQWQLNAGLQYVDQLCTVLSNPHSADLQSYTLLKASLVYQGFRRTDLMLNGNNLLNSKYENIRYYTMPGATVSAGIRYKF